MDQKPLNAHRNRISIGFLCNPASANPCHWATVVQRASTNSSLFFNFVRRLAAAKKGLKEQSQP
jgi:hypothetical protein